MKKPRIKTNYKTHKAPKKERKNFACGTFGTEFTSMKKVNDHSSIEHLILNLACKELACEYKKITHSHYRITRKNYTKGMYAKTVIQ